MDDAEWNEGSPVRLQRCDAGRTCNAAACRRPVIRSRSRAAARPWPPDGSRAVDRHFGRKAGSTNCAGRHTHDHLSAHRQGRPGRPGRGLRGRAARNLAHSASCHRSAPGASSKRIWLTNAHLVRVFAHSSRCQPACDVGFGVEAVGTRARRSTMPWYPIASLLRRRQVMFRSLSSGDREKRRLVPGTSHSGDARMVWMSATVPVVLSTWYPTISSDTRHTGPSARRHPHASTCLVLSLLPLFHVLRPPPRRQQKKLALCAASLSGHTPKAEQRLHNVPVIMSMPAQQCRHRSPPKYPHLHLHLTPHSSILPCNHVNRDGIYTQTAAEKKNTPRAGGPILDPLSGFALATQEWIGTPNPINSSGGRFGTRQLGHREASSCGS